MNISDPISDMLVRIRNANLSRQDVVEMPHSKMKNAIARILKREGFIQDFVTEGGGAKKQLRVYLKFDPGRERIPVIRRIVRVSKPGLRTYIAASDLKPVKQGTGVAVISTSKGLMTDHEARKTHLGGELLFKIW